MAARQAAPARRAGGSSPTHFLCIPLLRRQLACSMAAFKADVTSINAASPLPPSAVRPPGTMHITLGVMHLPTRAQVDAAVTLLRDLRLRDIISDARGSLSARAGGLAGGGGGGGGGGTPTEGSVWLTLRGLRAMQDPARTGVLYAPPLDADGQEAGLVYAFCSAVRQRFIDAGVMEAEARPFLLHATVVNTTHVKRAERGGAGGKRERLMIDGRGMMEEYEEFVWLNRHEVKTVAICRMGAKPTGDGDEAYDVVEEVAV